jgi:hypothetical protein
LGATLERQLAAVRAVRTVELDHQLPDLAGEKGAILFAFGQDQSHELAIISDGLLQVRRLERSVTDASRSDHGVFSF